MNPILFKLIRQAGLPWLFRETIQRNKVSILLFHELNKENASWAFPWLKRHYNIIGLQDYLNAVKTGKALPKKSLIITFDDGIAENYSLLPIIQKLTIPITIFLCSDIVGTKRHFWFNHCKEMQGNYSLLKALPIHERLEQMKALYGFEQTQEYDDIQALSHEQIKQMEPWVDFQSHTCFHACLTSCDEETARNEIALSKEHLERYFGLCINAISFPNGSYSERDIQLVKEAGYTCLMPGDSGYNDLQTDLFRLKRISVNEDNHFDEFVVKSSGCYDVTRKYLKRLKRPIKTMLSFSWLPLMTLLLLLNSCNTEEASERERTNVAFLDSIGGDISPLQWWKTSVTLTIDVTTEKPVKLWLMSEGENATLYDYKELQTNGTIVMTAPQGQSDKLNLIYQCNSIYSTTEVFLSGKPEEAITINTQKKKQHSQRRAHDESLSGNSIIGQSNPKLRAQYYEFEMGQLFDFFNMMNISTINTDAKKIGLDCNYELESNGPFTITWVNGYEASQTPHILGYYYHSPGTYEDIKYVDLSETHKWDYIDGLAKVQYKLSKDDVVDGHTFKANTWYDANFDLRDKYGSTYSENMARIGDNAYNMQEVFNRYQSYISGLRGISFDIDVPEGMHIGFYLRSDTESYPQQWMRLMQKGIQPYTKYQYNFMGCCFSAEALNVDGTHRSFVMDDEEVIWMGMEDKVEGGDLDCNDVIFGVVTKLNINYMPDIVTPTFFKMGNYSPFPWTIAYEDVNRGSDFDFNDAVIKLVPDYEKEKCCVTVMAAGSTARMFLHYDGPDGDQNLGEIHELLGRNKLDIINTKSAVISVPFVEVDCVPWPKDYTMANDAKRFYIEIQRGTCTDCNDVITLAEEPGKMPEAILVAGEWKWPTEGTCIFDAYNSFPNWSKDVTRTRFWEWYKTPENETYVSY